MAAFEELNVADKKKEMIAMPRHSFIQMTKLHNVMGRIDYITSTVKQENLYAIYATQPLRSFWKDLAKCNIEEFAKSGTIGKYIEARELIIALPEGLYHYEHDYLIKHFATDFKKKYGVDCYAALHHNKRKTNFHIHLIFAERTKLEKPVVKVASRNMFYDERGKHVRTKKEILDASGDIRNGCKIIRKGEVYEKKEFSIKVDRFKKDSFLDEAKVFFTNEINQLVLHEEDKLKVFDKNSPYLATKKIGRNNPKVEQIEQDNKLRMDWNREVDRAIISDVPMDDILQIKMEHITEPIKRSIQRYGNKPQRLTLILNMAITELVLLISKVLEAARTIWSKIQHTDVVIADKTDNVSHIVADTATHIEENAIIEDIKPKQGESAENVITSPSKEMVATQKTPAKPVMTPVVADYTKLKKIKEELDNQNKLIFEAEQRRGNFEIELSDLKGLAKLTRKAELQRKIDEKTDYIDRLKIGLSNMVRNYGFENMNEFYLSYKESKTAFADYQQKVEDWKKGYDNVVVSKDKTETMSEKLDRLQNEVESSRQYNKQNQAKWAR